MPDALVFVLAALGAYRFWRFVAVDDLPPVTALRSRVTDAVSTRHGMAWSSGIECPWCSGFWCSCAVVGALWAVRSLPLPGLWFLAVSAVVGLLGMIDDD